ncbi:hypothetical protein BN1723_019457, partial [Verticillium longisporum]
QPRSARRPRGRRSPR